MSSCPAQSLAGGSPQVKGNIPATQAGALSTNLLLSGVFSAFSAEFPHAHFPVAIALVLSYFTAIPQPEQHPGLPVAASVPRQAVKVPGFFMLLPLTPLRRTLPSNFSALIDSFSLSALNYLQR